MTWMTLASRIGNLVYDICSPFFLSHSLSSLSHFLHNFLGQEITRILVANTIFSCLDPSRTGITKRVNIREEGRDRKEERERERRKIQSHGTINLLLESKYCTSSKNTVCKFQNPEVLDCLRYNS